MISLNAVRRFNKYAYQEYEGERKDFGLPKNCFEYWKRYFEFISPLRIHVNIVVGEYYGIIRQNTFYIWRSTGKVREKEAEREVIYKAFEIRNNFLRRTYAGTSEQIDEQIIEKDIKPKLQSEKRRPDGKITITRGKHL